MVYYLAVGGDFEKERRSILSTCVLRDKITKFIKIEPWRSLKEEMNVLSFTDSDIF